LAPCPAGCLNGLQERWLVREKEFCPERGGRDAYEVIREISFSTDPVDFDFIKVTVPCPVACPAYTKIPAYIRTLYEGRHDRSYELNRITRDRPLSEKT
jgi:hypothetical protein